MSNEVENTPVEQEIQPLTSWDVDELTTMQPEDAGLMDKAIEVGTDMAATDLKEDAKTPVEKADNAKEAVESTEEVKADAVEKQTVEEEEVKEVTKEESAPQLITLKVNGKEQEVSLEELKSNYSGKVAYDKKFTELDKERKSFLAEKTEIENYVNEFRGIADKQNMVEATKFLGQITGKSPNAVVNELITALAPEIERRYSLTDDELALENKNAEVKYNQEKLEAERKQFEQKQSHEALQAKIDSAMSTHKISAEDWNQAIADLDARLPREEVITPELVTEFVQFGRASTTADSVLSSYQDGKFTEDAEVVKGLREIIIENPDFSNEDLVDILNESLNQSQKQEVEEKLTKKVSSSVTTTNTEDAPAILNRS